ncbi:MAG: glucosamine-6-phosphate deaminase [Acutalibacteraceae bacterium]|nr:glucosamine-6-phosphate deaminase [Acutalibacteraceae bacterium]
MKVIVLNSAAQVGDEVGKIFCDEVNAKHNAVLGLATGASPIPTYEYMTEQYHSGKVSFKDVRTFNLDEYCDLPKNHPNSFYSFMEENLFSKVDIKPENVNFLDGNVEPVAESARYAQAIKNAGGIDIQLLGIGRNGHIGFNEPADEFTDEAFKVKLTDSTIAANSQYFTDIAMPHYAITMGIGSIMRAKKIVLIATGESKAEAIKATVEGEVTPHCPASILQQHDNVTIFLDEAAASLLKK